MFQPTSLYASGKLSAVSTLVRCSIVCAYCIVLISSAGQVSNSLCSETKTAFPSGPKSLMLRKGVEGEFLY